MLPRDAKGGWLRRYCPTCRRTTKHAVIGRSILCRSCAARAPWFVVTKDGKNWNEKRGTFIWSLLGSTKYPTREEAQNVANRVGGSVRKAR
jgi:hypothetical protein